jgi:hypothetical protein
LGWKALNANRTAASMLSSQQLQNSSPTECKTLEYLPWHKVAQQTAVENNAQVKEFSSKMFITEILALVYHLIF